MFTVCCWISTQCYLGVATSIMKPSLPPLHVSSLLSTRLCFESYLILNIVQIDPELSENHRRPTSTGKYDNWWYSRSSLVNLPCLGDARQAQSRALFDFHVSILHRSLPGCVWNPDWFWKLSRLIRNCQEIIGVLPTQGTMIILKVFYFSSYPPFLGDARQAQSRSLFDFNFMCPYWLSLHVQLNSFSFSFGFANEFYFQRYKKKTTQNILFSTEN